MKTPVVIGVVVALHCVAIGTLMMTQGCGTTKGTTTSGPVQFQDKTAVLPKPAPKDVMPPAVAPVRPKPVVIKDEESDIFSDLPPMHETKTSKTVKETKAVKEIKKEPAKPATKSYTVKSGDSLGYIALRFKVSINEIKELNPSIKDPAKIKIGQVVKLPDYVNLSAPAPKRKTKPKPVVKPAAPAPVAPLAPVAPATDMYGAPLAPVATAPVAGAGEYVVVNGDFPEKIAKKLGVKLDDLMKANPNLNPKKLQINQKLVVPGVAPVAPAPYPMGPVDMSPVAPPAYPTSAVPMGPAPLAPVAPVAPAMGTLPPVAPAAPAAPAMGPVPVAPLRPAAPAVGAAAFPAVPAPARPVAQQQKHLVAPGETLKDIAMLYTVTAQDIMKANNMTSEAVAPGQSLIIPPAQ